MFPDSTFLPIWYCHYRNSIAVSQWGLLSWQFLSLAISYCAYNEFGAFVNKIYTPCNWSLRPCLNASYSLMRYNEDGVGCTWDLNYWGQMFSTLEVKQWNCMIHKSGLFFVSRQMLKILFIIAFCSKYIFALYINVLICEWFSYLNAVQQMGYVRDNK